MKNKLFVCISMILIMLLATVTLSSCDNNTTPEYTVTYTAEGATGEAPAVETVKEGSNLNLPENTFVLEGYKFMGWEFEGQTYDAGDSFVVSKDVVFDATWEAISYSIVFDANGGNGTMESISTKYDEEVKLSPNVFVNGFNTFSGWSLTADGEVVFEEQATVSNLTTADLAVVTLYAVWQEPLAAEFSQGNYVYDLSGADVLELPLDLKGSNLFYVTVDEEIISSEYYSYDTATGCLVFTEEFCLTLDKKDYTITAITDSGAEEVATCILTVMNSIVTSFDEETSKVLSYGKEASVKFNVNFGSCSIAKLLSNDVVVPQEYYSLVDNVLEIDGEWISKFVATVDFEIYLSNNDNYSFKVYNNVLFATDYDANTIHSNHQSNLGLNPLYQYSDNVSIVNAPENSGMSGKVLKITPNTQEVTYDCNGYLTLKTGNSMHGSWMEPGFKAGKHYVVSFDYYTVNTSVGTFDYRAFIPSSYKKDLLLGAENDNVLHHFTDVIAYEKFAGDGLYIYAKFIGGGGEIYIDNFRIIEIDQPASVTCDDYDVYSNSDYTFEVGGNAVVRNILIDNEEVEFSVNGNSYTISSDVMQLLEAGPHKLTVKTLLYDEVVTFISRDNSKAEASELTHSYVYNSSDLVVDGIFEQVYVTEAYLSCDLTFAYEGDYDFDQGKNSLIDAKYFEIKDGKLVISKELLDICYGESTLKIHFNNGDIVTLTINSNVEIYSDFDITEFNMPLNTSWNGYIAQDSGSMSLVTDENGNKSLRYCTNDCQQGHALSGSNLIYVLETSWGPFNYYLRGFSDSSKDYIVSFDYKVVNTEGNNLKYYFATINPNDRATKHYLEGESGTFEIKIIGGDTNYSRIGIGCDLPSAADCYLLFDNYRIVAVEKEKIETSELAYSYTYDSSDLIVDGIFENVYVTEAYLSCDLTFAYEGDYDFDQGKNSLIDAKYFEIKDEKLIISKELLDICYGESTLKIHFNNGEVVILTITSNVEVFSDFDITEFNMPLNTSWNGYIAQDSASMSIFTDENGNKSLRYCTNDCQLGHALSGSNLIYVLETSWGGFNPYYLNGFDASKDYVVSFDYKIVNTEGNNLKYYFATINGSDQATKHYLEGESGTFEITIIGGDANYSRFGIGCDLPSAADCYMLIDNYRIVAVEKAPAEPKAEASVLTHSYVYNSYDLVVDGVFENVEVTEAYLSCDLTFAHEGDYDFDQDRNSLIDAKYFEVKDGKLVISKELLDICYGESTLKIHFDNGDIVTLTINSNVEVFSDFDITEFNMPLGDSRNGYISQDSASMSVVTDENGNKLLRYCTNDCQQGHALAGSNLIYVLETSWGGFQPYYLNGFDASKDYVVSFDYKVVNTEGNNLKYYFATINGSDHATKHYLEGESGTFEFTIIGGDANYSRFGIGCDLPYAADCYLLIDNYRIVAVEKVPAEPKAEASVLTHSYVYNSSDLVVDGIFHDVQVTEAYLSCDATCVDEKDDYDYDKLKNSYIDAKYFEVKDGKLVISKELLNICYGESTLKIHFNNGDVVTLTINSNVEIFSDFDITDFNMPLGDSRNGYISQDSASMSVVTDENGNKLLRYCTNDCQQGHAIAGWNYIYVFDTDWAGFNTYYLRAFDASKDYIISFDYKVVNTEGNNLQYFFATVNASDSPTKHYLEGESGTFEFTIVGGDTNYSRIGIGCDLPYAADCYLLIDNYRIVAVDKAETN